MIQGKIKTLLIFAKWFTLYLFVCLGCLSSGNVSLLLQLPALVGFCYLKRLHLHKAFCKWQFVISWGGLKRDQLEDSLLLIFALSTSTLLTLVKSQPSAWVICVSVTSLPDIKSWLNTNHRLEPFVSIFALFLLSWITHWFQENKHFSMVRVNLSFMLVYTLCSVHEASCTFHLGLQVVVQTNVSNLSNTLLCLPLFV